MFRYIFILSALVSSSLHAAEVRVAVAANFQNTLKALSKIFEQQNSHRILITSGSTGKLYAQIQQGAPFDILLAADEKRPRLLEVAPPVELVADDDALGHARRVGDPRIGEVPVRRGGIIAPGVRQIPDEVTGHRLGVGIQEQHYHHNLA